MPWKGFFFPFLFQISGNGKGKESLENFKSSFIVKLLVGHGAKSWPRQSGLYISLEGLVLLCCSPAMHSPNPNLISLFSYKFSATTKFIIFYHSQKINPTFLDILCQSSLSLCLWIHVIQENQGTGSSLRP